MRPSPSAVGAFIVSALWSVSAIQSPPATTRGDDHFVAVNGSRLHYVDWGGAGEPMLFLVGGGNDNTHTFDSFAPRFVD